MALPLFDRALTVCERTGAVDSEQLLTTLRTLDGQLCVQGDYTTVRALCRRALDGFARHVGEEHSQTVSAYSYQVMHYRLEDVAHFVAAW